MDTLIVICAKYLIVAPVTAAAWTLWSLPREQRTRFMLLTVISLPLSYIAAKLASHVYYDPRPFVAGNFTPMIPHAADNGFPSDHTLLAAALAAVVTAVRPRTGAALWIIALVIGLSRVAAGVHHLTDIAGSVIIAAVATGAVYLVLRKRDASVA